MHPVVFFRYLVNEPTIQPTVPTSADFQSFWDKGKADRSKSVSALDKQVKSLAALYPALNNLTGYLQGGWWVAVWVF